MANTGKMNLLEEEGRIRSEPQTKNVKAEEKRVVGEIKKGYKKGGVAKKQGGGAMFSRGYGVGEPSRRMPTELLDRGPAYKKGGSIKKKKIKAEKGQVGNWQTNNRDVVILSTASVADEKIPVVVKNLGKGPKGQRSKMQIKKVAFKGVF